MFAHVICVLGNEYSERSARRCIDSAAEHGLEVLREPAIVPSMIEATQGTLRWTWAERNTQECRCPKTGLWQFPYKTKSLDLKIACFLSHYRLWQTCLASDEPMLILEHDAVFLRPLPEIEFKGLCQVNDPDGATRKGHWWSQQMKTRGRSGVFPKTVVPSEKNVPDGLAGNSAYLIKPWAAAELIVATEKLGMWPNDALMCRQLFPYLEEYYPFITRVQQGRSTTVDG